MKARWSDRLGAVLSTLMLGALATSAWLMSEVVQRSSLLPSAGHPTGPTARVFDAHMIRTNNEGVPMQLVDTPDLTQQGDGSMDLVSPTIRALRLERPPVVILSERAHVSADQERVDLVDNVRVSRAAFGAEPPILVRTPVLAVFPKEDIAKTEAPVIITRGLSTLTGRGLLLDQKTDRLTILAESRMVLPKRGPEPQ